VSILLKLRTLHYHHYGTPSFNPQKESNREGKKHLYAGSERKPLSTSYIDTHIFKPVAQMINHEKNKQ
jgi:hypothetical protein